MTVSLFVAKDICSKPFFQKDYTEKEFRELGINLTQGSITLLYPRRTDTLSHFCEDLFLPQVLSKKVDGIAMKIFSYFIGFLLDLSTFPLRLISALPRYLYNSSRTKTDDLFYKYLATQKQVNPGDHLAQDSVYVTQIDVGVIPGRITTKSLPFYFSKADIPVLEADSIKSLSIEEFFDGGKTSSEGEFDLITLFKNQKKEVFEAQKKLKSEIDFLEKLVKTYEGVFAEDLKVANYVAKTKEWIAKLKVELEKPAFAFSTEEQKIYTSKITEVINDIKDELTQPEHADLKREFEEILSNMALSSLAVCEDRYDGCGICEKEGGDFFWVSPYSFASHQSCYKKVSRIETKLVKTIDNLFQEVGARNHAHKVAIEAIKKELGNVSIRTFLETQGAGRLKSIFDRVGVEAVRVYYAESETLKKIEESTLAPILNTYDFVNPDRERSFAKYIAKKAVEQHLGNISLREFLKSKGADALSSIYQIVATRAVKAHYEVLEIQHATLDPTLNSLSFASQDDKDRAQSCALEAVEKELGGLSLREFIIANGADKLRSIFEKSGIEAIKAYYEILEIEHATLDPTLNSLSFASQDDKDRAESCALKAVEKELGGLSLREFIIANGADKLRSIFEKSGVEAIKAYYEKKKASKSFSLQNLISYFWSSKSNISNFSF